MFKGLVLVDELIDYEQIKWVNVTVFVYDSGKPQKHSILKIYCKVNDLNDNAPIFDKFIAINETNKIIDIDNKSGQIEIIMRIKNVKLIFLYTVYG